MLTEINEIILDNINAFSKTISIAKDTIIQKDGVEIARQRNRQAFVPGDIEAVKSYTGFTNADPEIVYLNSIWTQNVIDAYVASQVQL